MKKGKKDEYLDLLYAQHPDWVREDADYTLCLYMAFGNFNYCEGCWRLDDCLAHRLFEMQSSYDDLFEFIDKFRKRRLGQRIRKLLDWDLLLERIGQEAKLEIDNYLSEKLDCQMKGSRRKKKPTSSHTRIGEDS